MKDWRPGTSIHFLVCVLFLLIQNSRWEMNCGHFKNVLINIFLSRSPISFCGLFCWNQNLNFFFFLWDEDACKLTMKEHQFKRNFLLFSLLFLSLYMAFLWIYDPMNETKKTKKNIIWKWRLGEAQKKKLWMKFISWEIFHQIYNTYSCGVRALDIKK